MPKTSDIKAGKIIILKFDMPATLKVINSSDRTNLKNNMIDEIKKINGKSLYIIEGTFKKVKVTGSKNPTA
jgi:PII-like signaling protein